MGLMMLRGRKLASRPPAPRADSSIAEAEGDNTLSPTPPPPAPWNDRAPWLLICRGPRLKLGNGTDDTLLLLDRGDSTGDGNKLDSPDAPTLAFRLTTPFKLLPLPPLETDIAVATRACTEDICAVFTK